MTSFVYLFVRAIASHLDSTLCCLFVYAFVQRILSLFILVCLSLYIFCLVYFLSCFFFVFYALCYTFAFIFFLSCSFVQVYFSMRLCNIFVCILYFICSLLFYLYDFFCSSQFICSSIQVRYLPVSSSVCSDIALFIFMYLSIVQLFLFLLITHPVLAYLYVFIS